MASPDHTDLDAVLADVRSGISHAHALVEHLDQILAESDADFAGSLERPAGLGY